MTRGRLWSLVAFACAGLILPGVASYVPAQNAAVQLRAQLEAALAGGAILAPLRTHPWAIVLLAAVLGLGPVAGHALYTRRGGVSGRVRRLSQRGLSVATIARRTGLAQDAIRDLLGAEAVAVTVSAIAYHPAASAARRTQEAR